MSLRDTVQSRREDAVLEAARFLDGNPCFERLSREAVEAKKKGYLQGWMTSERVDGIGHALELFLPQHFPDAPPDIYLSGNPEGFFLKYPHIESSGKICVLPNSATWDATEVANLITSCLRSAVTILTDANKEDFRDESLIYWGISGGADQKEIYSCSPIKSLMSGCIVGAFGKILILAKDTKKAEAWLTNWRGAHSKLDGIYRCIIAEVNGVITPDEYPSSYADIEVLLRKYSPGVVDSFMECTCKAKEPFVVVFVQNASGEKILVGVMGYGKNLDHRTKVINGFRPGKAPASLLWRRSSNILKSGKVRKINVIRTDNEWIHSRGGVGSGIYDKKVTLIGCGSLGGYVAHLLARSGVGAVNLLDNDILEWENVGRHLLGASDIGRSKAEVLAQKIRRELPHLEVSCFYGDWRDWILKPEGEASFMTSDLIISTVADWRCERPLNDAISKLGGIDAIYSWLEPFGFATQALIHRKIGGCLECGMDGMGNFGERVFDFRNGTLRKEPGGCAYYQQYGPTKILPLSGMIVDAAIKVLTDQIASSELWTTIGDVRSAKNAGGILREGYEEYRFNELSVTLRKAWSSNENCKCCHKKER